MSYILHSIFRTTRAIEKYFLKSLLSDKAKIWHQEKIKFIIWFHLHNFIRNKRATYLDLQKQPLRLQLRRALSELRRPSAQTQPEESYHCLVLVLLFAVPRCLKNLVLLPRYAKNLRFFQGRTRFSKILSNRWWDHVYENCNCYNVCLSNWLLVVEKNTQVVVATILRCVS